MSWGKMGKRERETEQNWFHVRFVRCWHFAYLHHRPPQKRRGRLMEEEKNFSCFSISLLLGMDFSYSTRSRRGKKGTGECRRNLKNDDFNGDTEVGEDNRGEKKRWRKRGVCGRHSTVITQTMKGGNEKRKQIKWSKKSERSDHDLHNDTNC